MVQKDHKDRMRHPQKKKVNKILVRYLTLTNTKMIT